MIIMLFTCLFFTLEGGQKNVVSDGQLANREIYREEWRAFRLLGISVLNSNQERRKLERFYQECAGDKIKPGIQRFRDFCGVPEVKNFSISHQQERDRLPNIELAGFFTEIDDAVIIFDFVLKLSLQERQTQGALLFLIHELIKKQKKIYIVADSMSEGVKRNLLAFGCESQLSQTRYLERDYTCFTYIP